MGAFNLNSTWEIQFAVYIVVVKRVTGGKAFHYIKEVSANYTRTLSSPQNYSNTAI